MVSSALKNLILRFQSEETGQATVEYILILSVCVIGASQIGKKILAALDQSILKVGSELEKNLKTGKAPLSVWQN